MENIYSLIKCLTSSEWESFRNYLTCFSTHESSEVKYLKLSDFLRKSEDCPSQKRCSYVIYGAYDKTSIEKLKSRLKEKALDFLLTDISFDKQQELDEGDLAIIKIKKKSAQFQQLYYSKKRIPNLLHCMLDEIIALAKQFEQYSNLVEHLRLKKALVSWKKGKTEFEEIEFEIEFYNECGRLVNKAEHSYYELIMLGEFSGRNNKEKLDTFFIRSVEELDGYYQKTKSPLIKYHLKFLELGYYQHKENFLKSRSICLELLDIVRNNKSVYRRQRVGVVYDNLSRCEYYLSHFKQAAEWAREAQKHFNTGSENFCIALEQEFYALFSIGQYDQAVIIANKMINSASRKELGEFRYAKYNVLLANALFKLRRFNEALNLLSQEMEISKDKAGWETGKRILKIMTLIEMLKLDEASLAVMSLKQFFKYNDKKGMTISARDKKILNLLLVAERAGFLFSILNGNTEKHMHPLRSDDMNLRWEPFTHEVIPFHAWFAGKMKVNLNSIPKLVKAEKIKMAVLK